MSQARVIYQLARADFYERVRRYSFLVMLGLIVFLGYQIAVGNLTLQLDQYRGEFNSAWVGAMMAFNAIFFIGWFGFYLVKGSVARDRETGVGQILAATPLTRPLYMLGKWLSNCAVLTVMVAVLALAGVVIQFWKGESTQIDLLAFLAPFLLLALPLMALVAALAVLFEAIPFLQGGFGNIVYFFLFMFIVSVPLVTKSAFDPTGAGLMANDMGKAVRAISPAYNGSFALSTLQTATKTFTWNGIHWTANLVLGRLAILGFAVLLTLLAALFFDRFDPARAKPRRMKSTAASPDVVPAAQPQALPAVHLTPLNAGSRRFSFFNVLLAELKLLLKGQRWWWYTIAGGLVIACFANTATITSQIVLPLAWAWPVLIWSAIGNRETHHNVQQMTFSSASPLWRQLPVQWLAGCIVTVLIGVGALLRFTISGDVTGLLALLSGAIFIPSLALAAGVWSGTSKLFEILYILIWYLGPLNKVSALDFSGANSTGHPEFFIPLSLALIAFAILGRDRQLRS